MWVFGMVGWVSVSQSQAIKTCQFYLWDVPRNSEVSKRSCRSCSCWLVIPVAHLQVIQELFKSRDMQWHWLQVATPPLLPIPNMIRFSAHVHIFIQKTQCHETWLAGHVPIWFEMFAPGNPNLSGDFPATHFWWHQRVIPLDNHPSSPCIITHHHSSPWL